MFKFIYFLFFFLEYLRKEKLTDAYREFCRTSPYLRDEYELYKSGINSVSGGTNLTQLIREYCQLQDTSKCSTLLF